MMSKYSSASDERAALEMGADGQLLFVRETRAPSIAAKLATTTSDSIQRCIAIKPANVNSSTSASITAAATAAVHAPIPNQSSLYKLVAEARASSASNSDSDIQSLRVQLASARRTIASLQQQAASATLPPQAAAAVSGGDSLSMHATDGAAERCALLEAELACVKRERIADLESHAALQRVREAEIAEVASLRRLLADAHRDMQMLSSSRTEVLSQLELVQSRVHADRNAVQTRAATPPPNSALSEAQVAALNDQCAAAIDECNALKTALAVRDAQVELMNKQILEMRELASQSALANLADLVRAEFVSVSVQFERVHQSLDSSERRAATNAAAAAASATAVLAAVAVPVSTNCNDESGAEVARLQSTSANLASQLQAALERLDAVNAVNASLSVEKGELSANLAAARREIESQRTCEQRLQAQLDELRDKHSTLGHVLAGVSTELELERKESAASRDLLQSKQLLFEQIARKHDEQSFTTRLQLHQLVTENEILKARLHAASGDAQSEALQSPAHSASSLELVENIADETTTPTGLLSPGGASFAAHHQRHSSATPLKASPPSVQKQPEQLPAVGLSPGKDKVDDDDDDDDGEFIDASSLNLPPPPSAFAPTPLRAPPGVTSSARTSSTASAVGTVATSSSDGFFTGLLNDMKKITSPQSAAPAASPVTPQTEKKGSFFSTLFRIDS